MLVDEEHPDKFTKELIQRKLEEIGGGKEWAAYACYQRILCDEAYRHLIVRE